VRFLLLLYYKSRELKWHYHIEDVAGTLYRIKNKKKRKTCVKCRLLSYDGGCDSVAMGDPASKDSQMTVDLVVGGNENVSNTVVVETTQMQSMTAPTR